MNTTFARLLSVTLALGLAQLVQAQAQAPATKAPVAAPAKATSTPTPVDPRAAILKKIDGLTIEDVRISPVNGIFEIAHGADISYVSNDGKYAIVGDMIDLDTDSNLSENRRRGIRAKMLAGVPESEMVVYAPKNPKYTVTVFTDIDCGYCRRLHSQIAEYNRLGISVRYLFFPRSGPDTESWHKAEQVWCAPSRTDALTRAKNGEEIKASPNCPTANNIVQRDFDLGQKLSVEGTPAIFLASGEMLGGYAPPGQLAKYLKEGKL